MSEETTQTSPEDTSEEVNPQEPGAETTENPIEETDTNSTIDYEKKFSESSKEALRLLEENKQAKRDLEEREAELQRLRTSSGEDEGGEGNDPLSTDNYLDFANSEDMSEEERKNLIDYTKSIEDRTLAKMYKDPAISFAKQSFNEKKWNDGFEKVLDKFPDLKETKEEFKSKYFSSNNVPDNIGNLLEDLAKVHLFDKARDIGAKDAQEISGRMEIERAKGGDKTPTAGRSLEDWHRLASSNPSKFAKMSKQFNEDMNSGKLK